ncbi:MAG: peptidyl-prolyl cis-trans isomerase [Pseudomonadota bacterium]
MLTSLRELLRSKWIGGLVFGLVIISMALWIDLPGLSGGFGDQAVKAGERGFTMQEFDERLEQVLRIQRQQEGGIVTRRDAVEQGLVDQLFAVETSRMANLGFGARIGAAATDEYSTARVLEDESFADPVTGAFNADLYRRLLGNSQLTPEIYEQNLQDSRTINTLTAGIESGLKVPAAFSQLQATFLAESRSVDWVVIGREDAGSVEPPSDEALAAFYDEQARRFAVPERRIFSVLTLSPSDFVHTVEVSPEDLRAIYESQKAQRFSGPERRRFLEVVATSESGATEAFGRLAGGAPVESFSEEGFAAAQPRTALQSELTNAELSEALFDQNTRTGGVVGPFRSGDLWLVARLDDVIAGTPVPFESVSALIEEEFALREAENLFLQVEADLFDYIGRGLTLSEIASELGAPLLRYVPLSQSGRLADGTVIPALANNPDLMEAAFQGRIGQVTDPIGGGQQVHLVEVQDVLAPYSPDLADIRDRVVDAYVTSQESESLSRFANALVDDIQAGNRSLEDISEGLGKPLESTAQPISRANYDGAVPQQLLVPVFGANDGDTFTLPGPGVGQMLVAQVTEIRPPEPIEIEVLSGLVETELEQSLRNDLLIAMENEFRETLDVQANGAALDAFKRQILDQQ